MWEKPGLVPANWSNNVQKKRARKLREEGAEEKWRIEETGRGWETTEGRKSQVLHYQGSIRKRRTRREKEERVEANEESTKLLRRSTVTEWEKARRGLVISDLHPVEIHVPPVECYPLLRQRSCRPPLFGVPKKPNPRFALSRGDTATADRGRKRERRNRTAKEWNRGKRWTREVKRMPKKKEEKRGRGYGARETERKKRSGTALPPCIYGHISGRPLQDNGFSRGPIKIIQMTGPAVNSIRESPCRRVSSARAIFFVSVRVHFGKNLEDALVFCIRYNIREHVRASWKIWAAEKVALFRVFFQARNGSWMAF